MTICHISLCVPSKTVSFNQLTTFVTYISPVLFYFFLYFFCAFLCWFEETQLEMCGVMLCISDVQSECDEYIIHTLVLQREDQHSEKPDRLLNFLAPRWSNIQIRVLLNL